MSVTWLPKDRYTKAVFSAMESIGIEWRPLITGRNDRTVYFLAKHSQFGSIEAVKIGSTSHKRPNGARAKEVARQCVPSFCSMVAIIPNGDFDLEFELHKRFASSLIKGEWFNPDPDLMGLVSQLRLAIEKAE